MTAIVGLVHEGRVHIGGDSAGSNGWSQTVRADTKVFRNGPYLFGFTSSFRMGQLLHHALKPPAPDAKNLDRFMTTTFVDALRECLKAGGWASADSGQESGGTFLVGVHGRLFKIQDDYQVGESADPWDACGSGEFVAIGALYATASLDLAPKKRLKLALEAAARFNPYVAPPFVIRST